MSSLEDYHADWLCLRARLGTLNLRGLQGGVVNDKLTVRIAWRLLVAVTLVAVLVSVGACSSAPKGGNPALPAGFRDTPLPDVAIKGYLYFRQEQPVVIPLKTLVEGYTAPPGYPTEVGVSRWMVWVGPSPKDLGISLEVTDARALELVVQALAKQEMEFEHLQQGSNLLLLRGEGDWAQALKSAVADGRTVKLEERYGDSWELVTLLPEKPEGVPVAAGFGKLDEEFLNNLESEYSGPGGDVKRYASATRVNSTAFALYAHQPISRVEEFDQGFLKRQGLGVVLAARSGYPGFLINMLFGSAASRAGLTKRSVSEEDVYYAETQEMHLMVKNRGSVFFLALSPDEERAEALITSALVNN